MNRLQTLLANKHTSGAAVAYLVSSALEVLGPLWFPDFKHQFEVTAKWIEKAAFVYGLSAATDSGQLGQVKKDVQEIKTGNTNQFVKSPEPETPKPKDT